MLHAYELIPFDNPDGGVWKQGWEITYDTEKIKQEKKLEVVVLPHSHCDPGKQLLARLWIMCICRMDSNLRGLLRDADEAHSRRHGQTSRRKDGHEVHLRRDELLRTLVVAADG